MPPWIHFPCAKSEYDVTLPKEPSLDRVRPPSPLLPPIPAPKEPSLIPTPPILDEWIDRSKKPVEVAGAVALGLGFIQGWRERSLRWTAENSHRKPDTKAGWYAYRKQKKYAMIPAGIARGTTKALRWSALTASFLLLESATEHLLALNERWRSSRRRSEGEGAWWGAEFWAAADAEQSSAPGEEWKADMRFAASGAFAGTVLMTVGGLYGRFFPPVLRRVAILGCLAGGAHGYTFSYVLRQQAQERAEKAAPLGVVQIDDALAESVQKTRELEEATERVLLSWQEEANAEVVAERAAGALAKDSVEVSRTSRAAAGLPWRWSREKEGVPV